ncbi:MAG: hypothetical protein ABFC78_06575, partial [Methanoregula sp.]
MEKIHKLLLAVGALICIFLFWIDIYLGATGVVVLVALAMSVFIMEDSWVLAEITVRLGDEAKQVIVQNSGNSPAYRIHVTLIPHDIEFDLPELAADGQFEYPLPRMVEEAKAIVRFSNAKGVQTSRT